MNTGRQTVMDLVEEAKKRAVLLLVCVFGLSYLMSLTSSSVWVNLPAAASLIVFLRYISLDIDMRRRTVVGDKKSSASDLSQKKSIVEVDYSHETSDWRRKVNSPVEAAMDQFTRHLISEWVADLWYSRITPDKAGPEVLVDTMNSVLGEIAFRARDVNLIDFLTRDIVNLICSHLELYRFFQAKIKQHELRKLPIDLWDRQLKLVLAAENKLHPALFSADAEHKVLQHLMSGLMSLTFKEEDLRCSFFRRTVRELLACAVIRPVLNLANPRFINERIESVVLSRTQKADRAVTPLAQETTSVKPNGPTARITGDYFSGIIDHTVGVELVPLKHNHSVNPSADHSGEWGQMLDIMSKRKTQALAPEHFENMWTKGRNYKRKEGADRLEKQRVENASEGISDASACMSVSSNYQFPDAQDDRSERKVDSLQLKDQVVESLHNYTADDDESNVVTGLDSPGTKVWDSKNTRNAIVSRIRHPLESSEVHPGKTNNTAVDDWGRIYSGASASSSASYISASCPHNSLESPINSVLSDSFLKLRCEVLGANIVKSGSGLFAVYSISVTDVNNNNWSIKRRFRHFEELHRRLKEFPEYNLSLPPKHFLSSGLDAPLIQERSKLLDKYLKKLLQLPTVSGSIEVWDFLSVDSQTYVFLDSLSIRQTLSVPPNLSAPILDLVDVIFQLQDGGWIRRQAFWVAKQILQLGMGDAFDDWLIEKIQLLRKGSVIASAVERIEKILWPDGIFITKHPKRRRPAPTSSPKEGDPQKNDQMANSLLTPEQQLEADRRAKFVYELMIDNAPSALVGLVGRKEYEQGAHDLYFFLQSPVCMKHLAIELLELLLLSGFPELDDVVRQCHEEKEKFGVFEGT
ncbi:hypothetical protein QJS04_geneDACA023595 [Acorus gramineus]|uniref:Sorting nexin-13 n=1 Tax=Acorus gramineus TaxID=55184 RepID=A0AAV9AKR1_ACOGR|nr:hypothetical protein QJS04_geneDACA023595 [Acorus gramineus]